MADDNFRSYRNRDPAAPRRAGASDPWQSDDPLAELARLIGQIEPPNSDRREAGRGSAAGFAQPAESFDWSADDRYADQNEPAEENYDARSDERPEARYAGAASYRPAASSYADDDGYESQEPAAQYSPPAPIYTGEYAREIAAPDQSRRRIIQEPPALPRRQLPAFPPQALEEDYEDGDQAQVGVDEQTYELEDYAEEAPATRRRSGFFVVAAVLGLAVLGTAGAFAYRAMFGSSMLPSLPPIIKADNGPNKIVPNKPNKVDQADASSASLGEKLVSREEQPVDMPAPVNPAPRVVSTIPIFSDPSSGQAGAPNPADQGVTGADATASAAPLAPAPPPPMQTEAAPAPASSIWPPAAATAPVSGSGAASTAPTILPAPRKIHTVVIRGDQAAAAGADTSSAPAPAASQSSPTPGRTTLPRVAAQPAPRPMPAPRADANAPLSIVPDQGGPLPPPPPRMRTALAQPASTAPEVRSESAPSPGGGYAVQVTSQRSEADAQAEFRTLRAKFPTQLGGHEPIVRRADLGAKGVYYRALVGPFATAEQAAAMCSSLKAAGGSCIVQRD